QVDADAIADGAAQGDGGAHAVVVDLGDGERDAAVVEEDDVARLEILREALVLDRDLARPGLWALAGRLDEGDDGIVDELAGVAREAAAADLGAAEVLQDGDGFVAGLGGGADGSEALTMLLVGAVGEVEPGDVHASPDQVLQGGLVVTRGADGAD